MRRRDNIGKKEPRHAAGAKVTIAAPNLVGEGSLHQPDGQGREERAAALRLYRIPGCCCPCCLRVCADRRRTGLWTGLPLSAALALGEAWLGITLAYYTDWPVSFCIAILSAVAYFAAIILTPRWRDASKIEPISEQRIP